MEDHFCQWNGLPWFPLSSVSYVTHPSLLLRPRSHPIISCLLCCSSSSTPPSVLPPSSSPEPLEEHHVAQLLRCFSTDLSLGRHLSLDGAQAHHLHQCSYHLRLFRNWLISGQDPLEYLHGQPLGSAPSITMPRSATGSVGTVLALWFTHALLLGVSACLPVPVVMRTVSWSACELFWLFLFLPSPAVSLLSPPPCLQSVNSHGREVFIF